MKKILVVDNNRTIVEMLAARLEEAGYHPLKAYDGLEALDVLKSETPDLVVLDLIMPKIDGYRLARYLKGNPDYQQVPIIILTGIATEDATQVFEVDADAFIAKGRIEDTWTHLLTTIRWLEARRRPRRQILGIEKLYPREMTRELLLIKQHFDSMLQLMAEGVIEMDEQNRIFFANQAASLLLGLTEMEMFGRDIRDFFPGDPELDAYLAELPGGGKPRKTGLKLGAGGRSLRLLATPFFFSGNYIGSIALLEDVTSQIRKEKALEELMSVMIQSAPVGICLLDGDWRIVLANDHFRTLAAAKGEVGRKRLLDMPLFRKNSLEDLLEQCALARPDAPLSREITFRRSGGKGTVTYNFIGAPLHQQQDRAFFLLLVQDITEKAELQRKLMGANRELEAANQAKSNFLSIVSHELRTPLSVIRGYLGLILEGKIPGAGGEVLEALRTSDRRARHLQSLIEELLDISRIEAGKITLKQDIFDLGGHMQEWLETFEPEIGRKRLQVEVEIAGDLPQVVADHDKISQVFMNLLSNAVKFTPEGGRIAVSAAATPKGVDVTVRDTGIGIPEDKIPLIFNKFYQVDSTDTRIYGGAGLGLSIVSMMLEAMGGSIGVDSRPGQGSVFTVHLPAGPADALPRVAGGKPAASPAPAGGKGRKRTVLLIEDDEDTVKIIGYTMPQDRYDLVVCMDGFEAIRKAYTMRIDLVMVDIRLPSMSGYDFCRLLKAVEATSVIPIIILSAAGQEDEIRKGYEAGANDYIIKPFSPKDLLERVDRQFSDG